MSKAEILQELPNLKPEERREARATLNELVSLMKHGSMTEN
jgi:hypothetical protein